ncbi:hypothetical protein RP75_15205 [Agrobacterium arsenijevicii]|uniref:Uncharacterized protein n=1 Tax=Agrobacterium arsenijevicii TaxID=1585697 RepID=A0ABR5D5Y7_9HYPH|nr:hypothetical protein RP75_15205 [Agrobacterium arsenijevicii]
MFMALKLNDAGTGCSAMVHVALAFSALMRPLDAASSHSHLIHAVARTGPRHMSGRRQNGTPD